MKRLRFAIKKWIGVWGFYDYPGSVGVLMRNVDEKKDGVKKTGR